MSVATALGQFVDKNAGSGQRVDFGMITLTGTDAGNYRLTVGDLLGYGAIFQPEAMLPQPPQAQGPVLEPVRVRAPQSVFDARVPAPAAGSGAAGVSDSRLTSGSDAVRVEMITLPRPTGSGLVAVTVPSQHRSFTAPIPPQVCDPASTPVRLAARATLESGDTLPSWLAFNATSMTLVGNDVSDDDLSVRVALVIGGVRTVIVILQGAHQQRTRRAARTWHPRARGAPCGLPAGGNAQRQGLRPVPRCRATCHAPA